MTAPTMDRALARLAQQDILKAVAQLEAEHAVQVARRDGGITPPLTLDDVSDLIATGISGAVTQLDGQARAELFHEILTRFGVRSRSGWRLDETEQVASALGSSRTVLRRVRAVMNTALNADLSQDVRDFAASRLDHLNRTGRVSGAYYDVLKVLKALKDDSTPDIPAGPMIGRPERAVAARQVDRLRRFIDAASGLTLAADDFADELLPMADLVAACDEFGGAEGRLMLRRLRATRSTLMKLINSLEGRPTT